MDIWLPYLNTEGGSDVFTMRLAAALGALGYAVTASPRSSAWQYWPARLRIIERPRNTDIVITALNVAFAFANRSHPVIAIEHHCVLDPAYKPYRSIPQAIYHELMVRRFERASLRAADAVVAVSQYTADSLYAALGGPRAHVIHNGIETDFFCPGAEPKQELDGRPMRLLFVGNLIRRKGADLLPRIMRALGPGFELRYTRGLRTNDPFARVPGMVPLGRLTREELRDESRRADLLLFPTRFEGFGYAAAEAMACGTPVVTTRCSSLPELVEDGLTGRLCPIDDVEAFACAVRELRGREDALRDMGHKARAVAVERFSLAKMAAKYSALVESVARR